MWGKYSHNLYFWKFLNIFSCLCFVIFHKKIITPILHSITYYLNNCTIIFNKHKPWCTMGHLAVQLSFPGVYNSTVGIQISFQVNYNSTGGIQISFQGVYNSTRGIQIFFQGVYNSTGGIQLSFQGVYNSTRGTLLLRLCDLVSYNMYLPVIRKSSEILFLTIVLWHYEK